MLNTKIIDVDNKCFNMFTATSTFNKYSVYVAGEIGNTILYTEIFDTIRNAQTGDIVKIYINSAGGDLWTAMQFISVINESAARIVGVIEGECHSAAALIFLACHEYDVPEFASMLCHHATTGFRGKMREIDQWSHHTLTHLDDIMSSAFKNFLTEDEIKSMLTGEDFWFNGADIVKRLIKKHKLEVKEAKALKKINA